jgi:hypothetical protein
MSLASQWNKIRKIPARSSFVSGSCLFLTWWRGEIETGMTASPHSLLIQLAEEIKNRRLRF